MGIGINKRPSYPHWISFDYVETLFLWWVNSCSERTRTRYDSTPWRWYGTPIEARVRLDPFARGWSGGWAPFFLSLLPYSSIFYPYHMLTLDHNSNSQHIQDSRVWVIFGWSSNELVLAERHRGVRRFRPTSEPYHPTIPSTHPLMGSHRSVLLNILEDDRLVPQFVIRF